MLYVQLGLVAAMLVGLATQLIYGSESLLEAQWLDPLFWGLIVAGVVMAILDDLYCPVLHCPLRRILRRSEAASCRDTRCADPA